MVNLKKYECSECNKNTVVAMYDIGDTLNSKPIYTCTNCGHGNKFSSAPNGIEVRA